MTCTKILNLKYRFRYVNYAKCGPAVCIRIEYVIYYTTIQSKSILFCGIVDSSKMLSLEHIGLADLTQELYDNEKYVLTFRSMELNNSKWCKMGFTRSLPGT